MLDFCRYKKRAGFVAEFYMMPMALRIKQLREDKDWTQEELAAKCGISRSQLAQIESEARPANTLRLNSIAKALEVSPQRLFSTSDLDDKLLDAADRLSGEDKVSLVRMAEALAAQNAVDQ